MNELKIKPILILTGFTTGMLVGALTGCTTNTVPKVEATKEQQFEKIFEEDIIEIGSINSCIQVYKEKNTDILYCWSRSGKGSGLCVMLSPDGTPLKYEEWKAME